MRHDGQSKTFCPATERLFYGQWLESKEFPGHACPYAQDPELEINGLRMSISAYRVEDDSLEAWSGIWKAAVERLVAAVDGEPLTTDLPGLEGRWLVVVLPGVK